MTRRIICILCALAMVTYAYSPVLASLRGTLQSNVAWVLEVTATTGPTAVTVFELGNNRIRSIISVSVDTDVTERLEFTPPSNTRRYIIEVDPPPGTSSFRIKVTREGALVFPEETDAADTRFVLDVL